jgi:hypothetical protein
MRLGECVGATVNHAAPVSRAVLRVVPADPQPGELDVSLAAKHPDEQFESQYQSLRREFENPESTFG